jgi:hypothetical protein
MFLYQLLRLGKTFRFQSVVGMQFYDRGNPELGLTFRMLNVDVRARFFTGEEVEPESSHAENRRTHAHRIPRSSPS